MYNSTDSSSVIQAYSKLGWALFPCHTLEQGACSCGDVSCTSIAKHPLTQNGVKDASKDPSKIADYFAGDYSIANVGLACGESSKVFVLDVDDLSSLEKLENENGSLPKTWKAKTGSGGTHLFFRFDERCVNLKNAVKFAGGLDIRATGGYVILPPSIHKNGKRYEWLVAPNDCELATCPDWLIDLIPKHDAMQKIEKAKTINDRAKLYLQSVPPAISGENGHSVAFGVCCRCVELFGLLTDDELIEALGDWNYRCIPPWNEKELRKKLNDARKKVVTQSSNDDNDDYEDSFPVIDDEAFVGLAGEIVNAIEPETEADKVGVLLSIFTCFGSAIGNQPSFNVGASYHHSNLFACLVGDTASGKGLAWSIANNLFNRCDDAWHKITAFGLSSGEGLVERLADEENENVLTVNETKRLLCVESEFARPITAMRREGNMRWCRFHGRVSLLIGTGVDSFELGWG